MKNACSNEKIFIVSEQGSNLVEKFLQRKKEERETTEKNMLQALHKHEFVKACLYLVLYERKQVFPRGLGIDWNEPPSKSMIRITEIICLDKPEALSDVSDSSVNPIRYAAAMMYLLSESQPYKWLPKDFQTNSNLDANFIAHTLMMFGINKQDLEDYESMEDLIKGIQIEIYDDYNACSYCKKFKGKTYTLKNVPELPHKKCTSENGCSCGYLAIMKF